MDAATAWDECRVEIGKLARMPGAAGTHCPACPDWTVQGVVSHLTGIAVGVVASGAEASDVNADEATADQVKLRESRSIDEVIAEWDQYAEGYVARLKDPPAFGLQNISVLVSIFDIATHEHDIRYAIDQPGRRETFAVELGTKVMVAGLKGRHAEHKMPALRIEIPAWRTYDLGEGEPTATLTVDQFTLLRTLSGRRTKEQVAGLHWHGDNAPFLDNWIGGVFSWPVAEHER